MAPNGTKRSCWYWHFTGNYAIFLFLTIRKITGEAAHVLSVFTGEEKTIAGAYFEMKLYFRQTEGKVVVETFHSFYLSWFLIIHKQKERKFCPTPRNKAAASSLLLPVFSKIFPPQTRDFWFVILGPAAGFWKRCPSIGWWESALGSSKCAISHCCQDTTHLLLRL